MTGKINEMPIEGMGLTGFDNVRQLYNATWSDNWNTQLLTMKGAADPAGRLFTYYGEMDEPMLGVYGRLVKYQTRIIDSDTHVFSIYDLHAGDDYKVVEVTYNRRR